MQAGDKTELTIENIAFGGKGVGRLESGMACFVPFSAPGDQLERSYRAAPFSELYA